MYGETQRGNFVLKRLALGDTHLIWLTLLLKPNITFCFRVYFCTERGLWLLSSVTDYEEITSQPIKKDKSMATHNSNNIHMTKLGLATQQAHLNDLYSWLRTTLGIYAFLILHDKECERQSIR